MRCSSPGTSRIRLSPRCARRATAGSSSSRCQSRRCSVADRFEDARGVIQDLLGGPLDGVTQIYTRQGAIRGNHVHHHTVQWTYICWGSLLVATKPDVVHTTEYGPGALVEELPGIPHAWKALQ